MALVTVRSYRDPIDAELAKARLEGAGIPAFLADQHVVAIQWLYSIAIGGVKVNVEDSDLAFAREVLREDHSADLSIIPESESAPSHGAEVPAETLDADLRVYEPRPYLRSILAMVAGLAVLYYVWRQIHSAG